MHAYIARRLLSLAAVWLGISLLAFTLGAMAPGDPAYSLYSQLYGQPPPSQAAVDELREKLGLNDPFPIRYLRWVLRAARGDLGFSYRNGRPVLTELATAFGPSLQLAVGGLLAASLLAFPIGILSAVRHNSWLDMLMRFFSLLGSAMPSYWLAYLLILLFAVRLHWLPVAGVGTWRHLVLPGLTLGISGAAILSRLIRSSMLEVLGLEYVRTARAKGARERRVVLGHALRNALIPVVTVIGGMFGSLLAGAVIIETVFARPGVGRVIVDAISFRDYPVIQGFVLVSGFIFVIINLVVDLSYTWLDPRVRLVGEGSGRGA